MTRDTDSLRPAIADARAQLPDVRFDERAFAQHLAARAPGPGPLRAADLLLAFAAAAGDRAALIRLERSVLSQVPRWLSRFEPALVEEALQRARERLLIGPAPQILEYQGRGPLQAFVRVTALRQAITLQRQAKPASDGAELEGLMLEPDPERDFVRLRDREALREVLREAVRGLPARDLGLLRLHYLEGMSLEKLAALHEAARSTVARWLADARKAALARVQALLRERLRLSQRERESLLRFLGSELDLSLRSALTPPGER